MGLVWCRGWLLGRRDELVDRWDGGWRECIGVSYCLFWLGWDGVVMMGRGGWYRLGISGNGAMRTMVGIVRGVWDWIINEVD